ncbi:MAG: hypothetical protein KJZ69_09900 [Phycisphaerales bacterium]|nr:hypothetical protein [Phycisphaerales bacterium]
MTLCCPKCGYDLTGLRESRCPECGAAFDLAALAQRQSIRRPRRWMALIVVLVCAYGPFAVWIPFQEQAVWWKLWPILPGFFFGALLHPNEPLEFIVMGAATVVILGAAWYLASRASGILLVVCFLLLLWTAFNSWGGYAAMRM